MSDGVTRIMLNTRLDPGVQLNDTYEIDERIASGGMGEVYRGHNIQTGEPVAIKAILPELADKEAISALFKKEATTLGRLHHETIVRYYSFSRDPRLRRTYLAMEFVEGVSLADRMREAPLTPDEVRKLFAKVADGLALAHSAGVIHRDLSPDNIILRGGDVGRPTIIDFGIARSANVGEGTLIGGGFAGKFNFVSPEQLGIHNREVDARSDIYSLGLVIAAALRGSPIDMGGSHVEVIEKRSRLPDLSDIHASLRPLVEAMLQPNPDERPADAAAVSEWLRATAANAQTAAPTNGALAGATGAPGISFGAQPGPEGVPATTGIPFVAQQTGSPASPTQLIIPTSAPFPPPATGGGESPFGSAPTTGAPSQVGIAPAPPHGAGASAPGATGPSAPAGKSGTGRYAIAGGALLLLVAGGGAYLTGLIGPSGGTGDIQVSDQDSGSQQGNTNGSGPGQGDTNGSQSGQSDANGSGSGQDVKSAEHDNIGKAIEDVLEGDKSNGAGSTSANGQTTDTGPTVTDNGTATTDTGGTETSGTETTGTETTETGTADPGGAGAETQGTETTVTGPDEGTQQTTGDLTRMVDVGVKWLRQYDGGGCFFLAVTSVTDKTLTVRAFGRDLPAFQKLYNSFISANDFDPTMNGHPIREAQCAAVDFLKAVQPGTKDNPHLEIASERLKAGDTLNVAVDKVGGRKLDLLLIDADGFVHNMKSFAKETDVAGKSSFDIKLGGTKIDPDSPQMVIALTSPSGLAVPEGTSQARAADLFPRLGREIEVMKSSVGVDFGYFLLNP